MPMYYDLTRTKRQRALTGPHVELAMSFVEAIRGRNYFDRGQEPDKNELAGEDLTPEVVNTWALIRRFLVRDAGHTHFAHPDGLASDHDHKDKAVATLSSSKNGEEFKVVGHGHMTPPMFALVDVIEKWQEENPLTVDEAARARRDLEGLVGMRTAAARGKYSAEDVFGKEVTDEQDQA